MVKFSVLNRSYEYGRIKNELKASNLNVKTIIFLFVSFFPTTQHQVVCFCGRDCSGNPVVA